MPTAKKITITADEAKQRLDVFLSAKLKITRSQVQKMIANGRILLNGQPPKKTGEQLSTGDQINIQYQISNIKKQSKRDSSTLPTKSGSVGMTVVTATPDYIVIDKPTDLLTHPTIKNEPNAVSKILEKKYPEIKKIKDDFPFTPAPQGKKRVKKVAPPDYNRPGIVHRLDKEASGLLVVARTQLMFENLKQQFQNHTIEKEYLVLVHGRVAKDWGEINFPIARSDSYDRMAAIPQTEKGFNTEKGKNAATEFLVEKRFVNFTLLRVIIHTGRTHQIRAHMLAYNHPVVGDPIYNQKKRKHVWDEKCGRLFLHCSKLAFTDLKGKKQEFEAPTPKELADFLKIIK